MDEQEQEWYECGECCYGTNSARRFDERIDQHLTGMAKPNLQPGWLGKALDAPEKSLAELTEGTYNPFKGTKR